MARLWTTLYLKQYSMSVTDKHIELHRLGLFSDFHWSSISYLGDNLQFTHHPTIQEHSDRDCDMTPYSDAMTHELTLWQPSTNWELRLRGFQSVDTRHVITTSVYTRYIVQYNTPYRTPVQSDKISWFWQTSLVVTVIHPGQVIWSHFKLNK